MTPIAKKLSLGGLPLLLAFAGPALAQGAEVRVCDRPNFNGECVELRHGVADLRQFGMAQRATSFEIRSGTWLMCSEPGFAGRCVAFNSSVENLRRSGFNNRVASLRPVRRGDGGGNVGGNNPSARSAITLYERQNYAGRGWTFSEDDPDLSRYRLNDQISSVKVHGGRWRLCFDTNYGRCRDLEGSVPSLRDIGMNNTISSIQELRPGRPNDPGIPTPAPGSSVMLYEHNDFRGAALTVEQRVRDLSEFNFNDRVSSMRIPPGESWIVCTDADFGGRCATVTGDVTDLTRFGLNDRVSSLRRAGRR